jgi:polyribonucleotide nucleotidyltransferase
VFCVTLFPSDYHAEVQVMIQLMSHDDDVMPDALAGLAASAALACYLIFHLQH